MSEFGVPTSGQLDKINALAHRTLSKEETFVFSNKMVGDALLAERRLQLHKSLLEVFRNDARTGIAFMLDHPWAGMFRPKPAYPYGRTFDATLKKSDGAMEGENWALHGDVYIVRGKEKDGVSTDVIIADIEDGTMFDVSVGFGFSTSICSICGNEYYSSKCEHWRGQDYDGQMCYIIGKPPGWLGELSGVWDGAYPTAGVLSKDGTGETQNAFILLDEMPREDVKKLPSDITTYCQYSTNRGSAMTYFKKDDLVKGNTFTVPDLSKLKGSGEQMFTENEEKALKVLLDKAGVPLKEGSSQVADTFNTIAEKWDSVTKEAVDKAVKEALEKTAESGNAIGEALSSVESYMTQAQVVEKLGKELPAEKVLSYAKEGEAYMTELVDNAVAAGVRAQGNDFPAETWKNTFASMASQGIKDIMETFNKQAGEEIPAGRQSSAGAQGTVTQSELPDEAFQA